VGLVEILLLEVTLAMAVVSHLEFIFRAQAEL
jgi:hypothetical protein